MDNLPKELVIICPSSAGETVIGGGERYLLDLIPYLLKRDWQVTLASAEDSSLFRYPSWPEALQKESVSFPVLGTSPWKMLKAVKLYGNFVRRHPRAVFHGNAYLSLKWLAWAKIIADVTTVGYLQESFFDPYHSFRARCFSKLTDRMVAISFAVQNEFLKGTGLPPKRIRCIPHGIPINDPDKSSTSRQVFWERVGIPATSRVICMVGRTDPLKGHDVLVRAFSLLAEGNPDAQLVLVGLQDSTPGEKQLFDTVMGQVQSLGLSNRVKAVANVSNAREFMRHADIVAVPSISEGLGRVAIEGQAERTCVVASATGGLVEIVTDNRTGCLVPAGDEEALARTLTRLLKDENLRQRLALAGWQQAERKFSVQKMNEAFESIWLEAMSSR